VQTLQAAELNYLDKGMRMSCSQKFSNGSFISHPLNVSVFRPSSNRSPQTIENSILLPPSVSGRRSHSGTLVPSRAPSGIRSRAEKGSARNQRAKLQPLRAKDG
jgi:hypothetical protein